MVVDDYEPASYVWQLERDGKHLVLYIGKTFKMPLKARREAHKKAFKILRSHVNDPASSVCCERVSVSASFS